MEHIMDAWRGKITKFFNETWLFKDRNIKSNRKPVLISIAPSTQKLLDEYLRVYGIILSKSQIHEFLVLNEIEKIKDMPNYYGIYLNSNLTRLKVHFSEVKNESVKYY